MGVYKPGSENHAIDQAVVGIRIFGTVDDAVFQNAVNKAAELAGKYDLPGRIHLDPMSLVFGRQVISPGYDMPMGMSPGTLFQRVNADGSMAQELTVEKNAVTYRTRNYKRWRDVIDYITGIVCPVASILATNDATRLSVVELRCIDKFFCQSSNPPPLSDLLRDDTPHVTRHLLTIKELFHLHSGWFEDVSEAGRTLININIDINDTAKNERTAFIMQIVSKQAAKEGNNFGSDASFNDIVLRTFQTLHKIDKSLLSELLTDELQEAINLTGASGVTRA